MGAKLVRALYNISETPDTKIELVSSPFYVLLHFYDPMIINIDGEKIITNEDAFIVYTPDAFQRYSLYYGQFKNDYIYMKVDDPSFWEQFKFPLNKVFYLDDPELGYRRIGFIMSLLADLINDNTEEINNQLMYVLNQLSERYLDPDHPRDNTFKSKKRIVEIRTRVMQNPEDWTVKSMANEAFLSVSSFTEHYKELFGVTPGEELRGFIIDKAKSLLLHTNLTVSGIADKLRYSTPENFIRAFKLKTGVTPLKFRKNR